MGGEKMGGENDDGDGYGEEMEVRFRMKKQRLLDSVKRLFSRLILCILHILKYTHIHSKQKHIEDVIILNFYLRVLFLCWTCMQHLQWLIITFFCLALRNHIFKVLASPFLNLYYHG